MPINFSLADTSNGLLLSTLILYALAMLCYASDFAFARHRVMAGVTEAEAARTKVPALVGVGAGAVPAGAASAPVKADLAPADAAGELPPPSRWPSGFWLRLAFGLTSSGWSCTWQRS